MCICVFGINVYMCVWNKCVICVFGINVNMCVWNINVYMCVLNKCEYVCLV